MGTPKWNCNLSRLFIVFLACLYYHACYPVSSPYECHQRHFDNSDSFVCVCNGTQCDQPTPLDADLLIGYDQAIVYMSDRKRYRLHQCAVPMQSTKNSYETKKCEQPHVTSCKSESANVGTPKEWLQINVNASKVYQKMHGFGGSFSDSAGLNIQKLSVPTRTALLRAYFDKETGIGYSLGRVPMGGTDFSVRAYSYDEQDNDFGLEKFALAKEDFEWKIPFIAEAQKMRGQKLNLIASPWSPPGWMKTNGQTVGNGTMKGEIGGKYYQTFAQYFIRFFEEYQKHSIPFWACTTLNEPYNGAKPGMFMNGQMQREWAKVLGAAIRRSEFKDTLLLAHDDNRDSLFGTATDVIGNQTTSPIDGFSFHWYTFGYYDELSRVHAMFPNKFLIGSEASAGFTGKDKGVSLGNWDRALQYGRDIIADFQNWASAWIDWNLCLDQKGGPNFVNNFIDAAIIINEEKDEFYKQPTFYSLAHFSRFVPPKSERIDATFEPPMTYFPPEPIDQPSKNPVDFVAFRTPPHGNRVMVLLSNKDETIGVKIRDDFRRIDVTVPARAIVTVIWGNQ